MKNTMMPIASFTMEDKTVPTFRLIPTSLDCPYNEAIFDPKKQTLGIIGKTTYPTFKALPQIDNYGEPIVIGHGNNQRVKVTRELIETFYEYEISDPKQIIDFITLVCGKEPDRQFVEVWLPDYHKASSPIISLT
jgi:hypothetical protein